MRSTVVTVLAVTTCGLADLTKKLPGQINTNEPVEPTITSIHRRPDKTEIEKVTVTSDVPRDQIPPSKLASLDKQASSTKTVRTRTFHLCDGASATPCPTCPACPACPVCSPAIPLHSAAAQAVAHLRVLDTVVTSFRGPSDADVLTVAFANCISGLRTALAAVEKTEKITEKQLAALADSFPTLKNNARQLSRDLHARKVEIREAGMCGDVHNATTTIGAQTESLFKLMSEKVRKKYRGMVNPSLEEVQGILAERMGGFSPANCTNTGRLAQVHVEEEGNDSKDKDEDDDDDEDEDSAKKDDDEVKVVVVPEDLDEIPKKKTGRLHTSDASNLLKPRMRPAALTFAAGTIFGLW